MDGEYRSRRGIRRLAITAVAIVAVSAALAQQTEREGRAALETVRKEIKALEQRLAREAARRDEGAKALRAAELEIAAATRALSTVRTDLASQRAARRDLAQQADRANQRLQAERAALAQQVRLRYMTGHEELFRLLLSQESPATLGRMLVYYDYYNRARTRRIAAVSSEVGKLHQLASDTERVEQQLASLEQTQAEQVAALARSRDERKAAVASLDASIKDASSAVGKLRAEEKRLADLIKQLGDLSADFPVDTDQPFAQLKGKLAWPVQGRIVGDYGQPRGGGPVKWSGVLLEAAAGTPVRAVYHGRIAYADWLPGLGLLVIVDHGGGYMSLYGHNEALLKESGDWVQPGEPIAQVGDTGGQARPGLYFEIRLNGEPVNPHPWVGARPTGR